MADNTPFWSDNLQESTQLAAQQGKTLLCFVTDSSDQSSTWEQLISSPEIATNVRSSSCRLRIHNQSQEFEFLRAVCPVQSVPSLVLIKGGHIEDKIESVKCTPEQLVDKLIERFGSSESRAGSNQEESQNTQHIEQCFEFTSSAGRMRLPNNAYDALNEQTEKWKKQKISTKNILTLQLRMLEKLPALKSFVTEMRKRQPDVRPELSEEAINRLLNIPASVMQPSQNSSLNSTASSSLAAESSSGQSASEGPPAASLIPADTATTPQQTASPEPSLRQPASTHQSQRSDYLRQQREREASQRAERDRIKAQIKSDRDERRRLDSIRKQGELSDLRKQNSTTLSPSSTDIRVQVRTFDGSTLRTTFAQSATIANDVRPWIDETINSKDSKTQTPPYNLKLIMTPMPNRNIETSEEEQTLPDLGIVGSATLVMVPVKTYVESYESGSGSIAGSVIGGLMGAGGRVVSGALGMLGWGGTPAASATSTTNSQTPSSNNDDANTSSTSASVKVRTLADQRAEEAKKRGNQLYNGNSLDFQGRKDENDRKKD